MVADFYNEHPQSENSDNKSDVKRKKRRRNRDPYDYLPGSPVPEGQSDIEIRRALHWDNMLRNESESASALWSAEAAEDEILLNLDLSQATTTSPRDSRKLLRQVMGRYPFTAQADDNGELLRQAQGRYCPKLCYGRCPNNCPQYSNIERVLKKKMPAPHTGKDRAPDTPDESQDMAAGGRIKKRKSRADISSEKAAELLSQLSQTLITDVLQATQDSSRTVEEYADSGLRACRIADNALYEFPPVGFALPVFEPEESPTAWKSSTFVPERGRIIREGNNRG